MITIYAPVDEAVRCLTTHPVTIQPVPPRWIVHPETHEPVLVQCVHLAFANINVIVIKGSVEMYPDTDGWEKNVGVPFEWEEEDLAPKPWPEPPPQ